MASDMNVEDLIITLYSIDTRLGMWASGRLKLGLSADDIRRELRELIIASQRQ